MKAVARLAAVGVLAVASLAVTASAEAPINCGSPFILIGNTTCLYTPNEQLNWNDAKDACENDYDGNTGLAIIDDCSLLGSVWNWIGYELIRKDDHWLAGSDSATEGMWTWHQTGEPVPMGVPYWFPGQPDGGSTENKLVFAVNGYFADGNMHEQYYYICQQTPQ